MRRLIISTNLGTIGYFLIFDRNTNVPKLLTSETPVKVIDYLSGDTTIVSICVYIFKQI